MAAPCFGVSQFTTSPWPFERDVECCKELGISFVEICEFKLNRADYRPQLASLANAGLCASSVQSTVHALFPDSLTPHPKALRDRVRHIEEAIVRITPHVPEATPFVVITGAAPGGDARLVYDACVKELPRLADFAARHNVRIAFEPLNPVLFNTDTALWGLDDGLELVDRIGNDSLGLCLDTWNVFRTPHLHDVIRQCRDRIFVVQISDWHRPRSGADRVSLGDGAIDHVAIVRTIRSIGYQGPYVLEIFSAESLPDSIWRSNLKATLTKNRDAFAEIWDRSNFEE
jgi:sugar phosphate isomerase/epimerase